MAVLSIESVQERDRDIWRPASDLDTCYKDYLERGGLLSKSRYMEYRELKAVQEPEGRLSQQTMLQAENIARIADITLAPEEAYVYSWFRVITGPSNCDVGRLRDPGLLAQVFLLGGNDEAFKKLIAAFPNIFE